MNISAITSALTRTLADQRKTGQWIEKNSLRESCPTVVVLSSVTIVIEVPVCVFLHKYDTARARARITVRRKLYDNLLGL